MSETIEHLASCHCGQLSIRVAGDPDYVSSCCCQACQRRTGSLFGVTAFYRQEQIVETTGERRDFTRTA